MPNWPTFNVISRFKKIENPVFGINDTEAVIMSWDLIIG